MIELVSRKSVFLKNPKIGSEIHLIQKTIYDNCFNETGFPLTEKQLIELQLEFDHLELEKVIAYDCKLIKIVPKINISYSKYYKNIANQLDNLLSETKTEKFYIISHLKQDFFHAMKSQYKNKRFRKVYSKLENKLKLGSYNEAVKICKNELIDFLEILNQIDSIGGGVPEYILICDENDKFCFYFHYSGEITFWSFDINDFLHDIILKKYDFQIVINNS
jgi:hypothetical protein